MKKKLLLLVMMLLPMVAMADPVEIDGIYYNLVSKVKQAEVTEKPSGSYSGSVNIPSVVSYNGEEYSVTSIRDFAFYNCSGLTSVTIPNSVTSIGDDAFYGCSGLTSVTIPNSVTSIGDYAFRGCSGLTSVHITDIAAWCNISFGDYYSNPLVYAHHLYMNGSEITDLVIPNSVTSIGEKAFQYCSGLTSVTIGNSVTSIGSSAFQGCTGLTSVTIPNSVTSIGSSAFQGCTGLTSVTIPNSVTSIGDFAFYNCSGLTSVTIGNSVTSIGHYAFNGCSGLKILTIPNNVTSIGVSAFEYCTNLTYISIGSGVTSIGSNAFTNTGWYNNQPKGILYLDNCLLGYKVAKLAGGLVIEDGTRVIADYALRYCELTSVTIPNSVTNIGEEAFYGLEELTSIIIPNNVTSLGDYAFARCYGLTSIVLGSGLKNIGDKAFFYCTKIKDMYCYAENVPTTNTSAFSDSNFLNAILHVPEASISSYSVKYPWQGFQKIIALNDTDPDSEIQKCAMPTIAILDGKLKFSCETEGVTYKTICTYDNNRTNVYSDEFVLAGNTICHVSVYATKDGLLNSDVATADVEIDWGKKGDTNQDGKVTITDAVSVVNIILNNGEATAPALQDEEEIKEPE